MQIDLRWYAVVLVAIVVGAVMFVTAIVDCVQPVVETRTLIIKQKLEV